MQKYISKNDIEILTNRSEVKSLFQRDLLEHWRIKFINIYIGKYVHVAKLDSIVSEYNGAAHSTITKRCRFEYLHWIYFWLKKSFRNRKIFMCPIGLKKYLQWKKLKKQFLR